MFSASFDALALPDRRCSTYVVPPICKTAAVHTPSVNLYHSCQVSKINFRDRPRPLLARVDDIINITSTSWSHVIAAVAVEKQVEGSGGASRWLRAPEAAKFCKVKVQEKARN